MNQNSDNEPKSPSFDVDNMLGGEPQDINAKTDNDRLAGIIPDPRLPVPPEGASIKEAYSNQDERQGG
jgi:hypothetical protein